MHATPNCTPAVFLMATQIDKKRSDLRKTHCKERVLCLIKTQLRLLVAVRDFTLCTQQTEPPSHRLTNPSLSQVQQHNYPMKNPPKARCLDSISQPLFFLHLISYLKNKTKQNTCYTIFYKKGKPKLYRQYYSIFQKVSGGVRVTGPAPVPLWAACPAAASTWGQPRLRRLGLSPPWLCSESGRSCGSWSGRRCL